MALPSWNGSAGPSTLAPVVNAPLNTISNEVNSMLHDVARDAVKELAKSAIHELFQSNWFASTA
ncbi:MAG: hypothetical protein JO108_34385 [Acidobacteriaceae bacterium]|nr:hypothetical protein [Acidobacteriaceae bacterium]